METTERIVEAYCRYIKHWFTIPNIRVKNNEIDLIAVDIDGKKAHIEIGVSISGSFSKLKDIEYQRGEERDRVKQSTARTKLGYFENKKFGSPEIIGELRDVYGFEANSYRKIIVVWSAEETAIKTAKEHRIDVWLLPELIQEIESHLREESGYYRDDTIRTLHLAAKTASLQKRQEVKQDAKISKLPSKPRGVPIEAWHIFISNIPKNVQDKTYKIREISAVLNYNLESEKSPIEHNAYWQGKHPHSDLWRKAGWKAKPIRDKNSGKIVAVKFTTLAQGKFI
jgi:hypothetical protein